MVSIYQVGALLYTEATGIEPATFLGETVFKTVRCANQLTSISLRKLWESNPPGPYGTNCFPGNPNSHSMQVSIFNSGRKTRTLTYWFWRPVCSHYTIPLKIIASCKMDLPCLPFHHNPVNWD